MKIGVIVPSKTASNIRPCAEAVRKHEPDCGLYVIDDGIGWDQSEWNAFAYQNAPCDVLDGIKPFVYSRNVNIGIRAALEDGCDGVVLLNDDALLTTAGGFTLLAQTAADHPEYGVVSAAIELSGNPQQRPRGVGLREATRVVAFVCVYLPVHTIKTVGLLDERFGGLDARGRLIYGWEDNDLCRRIRNVGMRLAVQDGCVVDHGSLKSTFRGDPRKPADLDPGRCVYRDKWGDCN